MKPRFRFIRSDQAHRGHGGLGDHCARGSALVLSLVVVGAVVALGLSFLQVTQSVTKRQMAGVAEVKAFYLAEAGLAEAFHAVRMGRTGQIGAEDAPARHGEGLLWVDALATPDQQVRLESTALVGAGRKTLALVVEPVEIPLGFFSDEDLAVESVLLVDGFDSGESPYEGQTIGQEVTIDPSYPFLNVDEANDLLFYEGAFYRFYAADGNTYSYDQTVTTERLSHSDVYGSASQYEIDWDDFIDGGDDFTDQEYDGVLAYFATLPAPEALEQALGGADALGATTGKGGLLSSNGDVRFVSPLGEPVQVFGDVIPGPGSSVDLLGEVTVTGDTTPRLAEIALPPVAVPGVAMAAPVRHDDVLPLLVSPGTSGHARIEVAADSELILRGPASVVIGELVLEPGAFLSLDTRDGDVTLYVTEGLDLQPGSTVTTTSEASEEVALQVGAIATGPEGAPVKLEATSQFHGRVYAPETEVLIGSEFEIYGAVVARRLEIGPGARLHFDQAEYEGSPLPRFLAWRIIEVPAALKARLGSDPYAVLGVERDVPAALTESHDLSAVQLSIVYLDLGRTERSYDGTEDGFDWSQVSEVLTVTRVADRTEEEPDEEEPDEEEPDDDNRGPRADNELQDLISDPSLDPAQLSEELLAAGLLSDAVLIGAIQRDPPMDPWDLYGVLEKNGPYSAGFPSAEGDGPLSDGLLLELVQSGFPSKQLSWALEQNSPLSDAVLQAAINCDPPMNNGDLNRVLWAQ